MTAHSPEPEAATAWLTKRRLALVALVIALPVLGIVIAADIQGESPLTLVTPGPSPALARQQAQHALDLLVKGIEGFRQDSSEDVQEETRR